MSTTFWCLLVIDFICRVPIHKIRVVCKSVDMVIHNLRKLGFGFDYTVTSRGYMLQFVMGLVFSGFVSFSASYTCYL